MSSSEPGGARLSACTLQLLESSQGQEKVESMGALWASSAGRWLVEACAADRQLGRLRRCREGAAKICVPHVPAIGEFMCKRKSNCRGIYCNDYDELMRCTMGIKISCWSLRRVLFTSQTASLARRVLFLSMQPLCHCISTSSRREGPWWSTFELVYPSCLQLHWDPSVFPQNQGTGSHAWSI